MAYISTVERIGMRKGFAKGHVKGREEGREELLLEQLACRFGPLSEAVAARIKSGSPAELGRWGRRVLSASTLDDVFANDA